MGGIETPDGLAGSVFTSTIQKKAKSLKKALIEQTLNEAKSWAKAVNVQWAQTHPGQAHTAPISDGDMRRFEHQIAHEDYEWVVPAFEKYFTPDPDALNPVISGLRSIEGMFQGARESDGRFSAANPSLGRINDVRADMNKWEGALQENFIDNFVTPLGSVSQNQAPFATLVREQLECNKVLYVRLRQSVLDLVEDSVDAVNALSSGTTDGPYWGTVAALVLGAALAVEFPVVGAVLTVAGTMGGGLFSKGAEKTKMRLAAPTAQEIAIKISNAMSKLDADVDEEEQKVRKGLESLYGSLAGPRGKAIAANKPGDFAMAIPDVVRAKSAKITDGSLRPAS